MSDVPLPEPIRKVLTALNADLLHAVDEDAFLVAAYDVLRSREVCQIVYRELPEAPCAEVDDELKSMELSTELGIRL